MCTLEAGGKGGKCTHTDNTSDSKEESRLDVRVVASRSLTLAQFSSNTLVKALEMTKLGYAQAKNTYQVLTI